MICSKIKSSLRGDFCVCIIAEVKIAESDTSHFKVILILL